MGLKKWLFHKEGVNSLKRSNKVVITRDSFNLKGQVAEVIEEYPRNEYGFKKYRILTNENTKVTLYEGDFEPLMKLVE